MRPSSRDPYLLKEVFLRSVLDTILNMISLSLLPCRKKKLPWNMLQRLKRQDSQWHAVKHFYPARNGILWRHRSHKSSVETNVFKTLHPGVWQDGIDSKLQMIEVLLGCNYPLLKQSELSALINRFLFFLETAVHLLDEVYQEQSVQPQEERQGWATGEDAHKVAVMLISLYSLC